MDNLNNLNKQEIAATMARHTEEGDLQADLARLDRERPDWDSEARLATAIHLLEHMPRDVLVSVYGVEVVCKAEGVRASALQASRESDSAD